MVWKHVKIKNIFQNMWIKTGKKLTHTKKQCCYDGVNMKI